MIKRIVKLEIKPNKVDEFKQFFENNKSQILTFDGCESVTLLHDVNDDCTFFTHSFWKSENHLNSYRNSDFFNSVWSKVKLLFNNKPMAWSLIEIL
ncbi:antibiotic biosynthesis monooxygenase [Flavobacteriales bacterium]|nr:antibiotic biosynthesis monooxygenase [Flavobacteriales bacterium]